uniref:Uncharacterized protein n=1 Tax=Tetranychus urticae TaxID=32264 RepID=T1L2B9_TETUR
MDKWLIISRFPYGQWNWSTPPKITQIPPDFERIVCCTLGFHLEKTKGKHVISASTAEGIKKKSEVAGLISGTSLGVAKAALKNNIY